VAGHYAEFMAAATEISKTKFLSHSSPQQSCGVFWHLFIKALTRSRAHTGDPDMGTGNNQKNA
jgi:hypothetical protein